MAKQTDDTLNANKIPNVTIVTCCFCLFDTNNHSFDYEKIMVDTNSCLESPCYLIIFCDNITYSHIYKQREANNLLHLTKIITIEISDLWAYQFKSQIIKNREIFWGSRDVITNEDTHIINCSKCDCMLQAIHLNPFNTSKFCYMNCFLRENAKKICEDYTIDKLLYVLNNITDKFHLQVLNVNDKKYKNVEFKKEYYESYRYVMSGCFFTCGIEIGKRILNRVNELFIHTTNLGYGDGEEMLFLEILDEFKDDIVKSYGDYGEILNNFIKPTRNYHYIIDNIIKNYINFGYNNEAYECCNILINQIENKRVEINQGIYLKILFYMYVSSYYCNPNTCLSVVNKIYTNCQHDTEFNDSYNMNSGLYNSQLKYIKYLKPHNKLIICVFACATVPKYKNQILKIEETWGKCAADNGVKVLYFLGEEETDLQDKSKYIYLPGVNNDYESASLKQSLGLKYIYDNFNSDYVFVCGTDTYVNIKKMLLLLNNYNCENPLYIGGGHIYTHTVSNIHYFFHNGGAGFIISKESLYLIYMKLWNMNVEWKKLLNNNEKWMIPACDIEISYFLQKHVPNLETITLGDHFFNCDYNGKFCKECSEFDIEIKKENIITCHNMSLTAFDEFTELLELNNYYL